MPRVVTIHLPRALPLIVLAVVAALWGDTSSILPTTALPPPSGPFLARDLFLAGGPLPRDVHGWVISPDIEERVCGGVGGVNRFSAINAQVAWLLCGAVPSAGSQIKELYRTADGGMHWRKISRSWLPGQIAPPKGLPLRGYARELFFVDRVHGWLTTSRGTALWATADGGYTWQVRAGLGESGFYNGVYFTSPLDGFLWERLLDVPQPILLMTNDGGWHWNAMPMPEACLAIPGGCRGYGSVGF